MKRRRKVLTICERQHRWIRRFTLTLATVLLCVCQAQADLIPGEGAPLVIPAGSTITSMTLDFNSPTPTEHVNFTFADGAGSIAGNGDDGEYGFLNFTVPVTSLTVNWLNTGYAFDFFLTQGSVSSSSGTTYCFVVPNSQCPESGTFTWEGSSIVSLAWTGAEDYTGVDSMAYILDGPVDVPEPTVPALMILGAICFVLWRRLA